MCERREMEGKVKEGNRRSTSRETEERKEKREKVEEGKPVETCEGHRKKVYYWGVLVGVEIHVLVDLLLCIDFS